MTELGQVSSRLGGLEATASHTEKRLDKIEEKLDTIVEKLAVVDHMRRNIQMMKQPVEDYKKVKERGMGMWTLFTFLLGGATVAFNVLSYIIRVWVLKIGE